MAQALEPQPALIKPRALERTSALAQALDAAYPRITAEGMDLATLAISPIYTLLRRGAELLMTRLGWSDPADSTRLGAFQATLGHDRHTVGRGANNSIAGIYLMLGKFGEDKIGDVFFSDKAQRTLAHPVESQNNGVLAQVEWDYWHDQWKGQRSAGGFMGTQVTPATRRRLQRWLSKV